MIQPRWLWFVLLLTIAGTGLYLLRDSVSLDNLVAWVDSAGVLAPVVFVLIYAGATLLLLPGSALTLAGGALFGPWLGTLLNLSGAVLGAALAFLLARHLLSGWVEARLGARMLRLQQGVQAEGWRFVAFVRLVPLFPFVLVNYAMGITRIGFSTYMLVSCIAMLPATAAYTWLGYAGRSALQGTEGAVKVGLTALVLLAIVLLLPRILAVLRSGPSITADALRAELANADSESVSMLLLDLRDTGAPSITPQSKLQVKRLTLDQLAQSQGEFVEWQQCKVILLSDLPRCSTQAARLLAAEGFVDVRVLRLEPYAPPIELS